MSMSASSSAGQASRRALVVGSGAREHALVRALVRSGAAVTAAPGNPGIARLAAIEDVAVDDVDALVRLADRTRPDLVVIGPEKPLTMGLADALRARGHTVFGPGRAGARLEGSKSFMKEFLARHGIPTAPFRVFDDPRAALEYVATEARPLVVKADGLAAGKGVVVATTADEAAAAVRSMMVDRAFGEAGARVVIEDVLPGEEASFHVVCSVNAGGDRNPAARPFAVPLAAAQDHKRIFDGDRGPNTGGMGAYAPAPVVSPDVLAKVMTRVVEPTLRGLQSDGIDYRGVIFVGLMIQAGEPRVLEYNVRFGDPETTVILPLFGGDVFELLSRAARGESGESRGVAVERAHTEVKAALSVVLAAEHYPSTPAKGDVIEGVDRAGEEAFVHHAGTRAEGDKLVTAGGRVLTITGEGATLQAARDAAYRAADAVAFRGKQMRRDIGHRALG